MGYTFGGELGFDAGFTHDIDALRGGNLEDTGEVHSSRVCGCEDFILKKRSAKRSQRHNHRNGTDNFGGNPHSLKLLLVSCPRLGRIIRHKHKPFPYTPRSASAATSQVPLVGENNLLPSTSRASPWSLATPYHRAKVLHRNRIRTSTQAVTPT